MNKLLYLIDDGFQSQQAAKCDLLVHIGLETFQYAVIDNGRDQLKALAEFELPAISDQAELLNAIQVLPESSREFRYPFNRIRISFDTFHYTFIPQDLFQDENERDYLKFIRTEAETDVLVNTIRSAKLRNVTAIDPQMKEGLNRIFQKPKISNQASPFIEGIKRFKPINPHTSLHLDISDQHIQAGYLVSSELRFYNIFDCVNPDEFNYFLLNILEQQNINEEDTEVVLSGKIREGDDIYLRVQKYFEKISFADTRDRIKYPDRFDSVAPHTYFSLVSLILCE